MNWIIRMIASSPTAQARISKAVNGASIAIGSWTLSHMYDWLTAHATYFTQAQDQAIAATIATCVAGLVVILGGFVRSQLDVGVVDAKIKIAAITGDVSKVDDPSLVKQVKQVSKDVQAPAGSPEALAELQAKLAQGRL